MHNKKALIKKAAAAAIAFNICAVPAAFAADTLTSPETLSSQTQTQLPAANRLADEGSYAIDPILPWQLILGLGAVYGAACLYRRQPGTAMRLLSGGTIALVLLNPQKIEERREILPTEIIVAVDKSASQTIGNRSDMTQEAADALMQNLNGIEGLNIRTVEIDGLENGEAVDGTALFRELDKAMGTIARDRLGGVFVLSDGQVHDVPLPAQWTKNGVPLHALISGRSNEYDRRIVVEQAPHFGMVDTTQSIRFRVLDDGGVTASEEKARVSLHHNGEEIATRFVTPGETVEMQIGISSVGSNLFELRTDAVAGELTDVNNHVTTSVEGIRQNLNVLLLSGAPNRNTRLFREMFKSDPDINLTHQIILRPPEKEDETPLRDMALTVFPTKEIFTEKLEEFDLVIFDNYQRLGLIPPLYFSRVAEYVNEGGSLLVMSGEEYAGTRSLYETALSSVLPAAPTGGTSQTPYTPSLNETGERHPVTRFLSAHENTGEWINQVGGAVASGQTVMEGASGQPLVVLDRANEGRVGMIMSDNLWLWKNGHDGGGPSVKLLKNITNWVLKDPAFEEEALQLRKDGNELIVERQTLSDTTLPVEITTPSGRTLSVTLQDNGAGLWRATVPATESGVYAARQDGETPLTSFTAVNTASPKEMKDTVSTTARLQPVTDASGGYLARMQNSAGELIVPEIRTLQAAKNDPVLSGAGWAGIRMSDASVLKGIERNPLIPGWLATMVFIGAVAGFCTREGDSAALRRIWPFNRTAKKGGMNAPAP